MDKASRATAYVFDSTEADYDRLIHQARLMDDFAREGVPARGLTQRAPDARCGLRAARCPARSSRACRTHWGGHGH
jgi:hypothetical protein